MLNEIAIECKSIEQLKEIENKIHVLEFYARSNQYGWLNGCNLDNRFIQVNFKAKTYYIGKRREIDEDTEIINFKEGLKFLEKKIKEIQDEKKQALIEYKNNHIYLDKYYLYISKNYENKLLFINDLIEFCFELSTLKIEDYNKDISELYITNKYESSLNITVYSGKFHTLDFIFFEDRLIFRTEEDYIFVIEYNKLNEEINKKIKETVKNIVDFNKN